jgi:hypothetical protein
MTIKAWIPGESVQQSNAGQGLPTTGLVATGNNQATALAPPTDFLVFSTVAASAGVKLLGGADTPLTPGPCTINDTMTVVNHGASTLTVYPQLGGSIANAAVNAGFSVAANKTAFFVYLGSGTWAASVSA